MLTLSDIDNMFPETRDGSVYSDLFKDVNGFRPRGELAQFANLTDFRNSWDALVIELENQMEQDRKAKLAAVARLNKDIELLRTYFPHATQLDMMRYLADANDCYSDNQGFSYYDWEFLDYKMGVKYGTCEELANAER